MTSVNLFPAILMAGPPHAGKSVLAYHFSTHLKNNKTSFILLRTTPDGEGDWFLEAERGVGIALRQKKRFTPTLVTRAAKAIQHRQLPMLVDVGGKPRGNQFRILHACTHFILLYRTQEEREQWQAWLDETSLIPIAYLQSDLNGEDVIMSREGPLQGVISGLDRQQPRLGETFQLVLDRVEGIFDYPPKQILTRHLKSAPQDAEPVVVETLARQIGVQQDHRGYWWTPQQIPQALDLLPAETPIALYGRGPAWLYAAIAIATLPYDFHLFDARHFGWMHPPSVELNATGKNRELAFVVQEETNALRVKIHLYARFLTPNYPISLPPLPPASTLILDGKEPLWLYTALARALVAHYPHIAVYDPRTKAPVLVR